MATPPLAGTELPVPRLVPGSAGPASTTSHPASHEANGEEWVSAHLALPGSVGALFGEGGDDAIRRLVRPLIDGARREGCVTRAFFVRYTEGGPHIRLRLLAPSVEAAEHARHAVVNELRRLTGAVASGREPHGIAPGALRELSWVAYSPEVERYGGPRELPIAEEFFSQSTTSAIRLVEDFHGRPRAVRVGRAMLAMLSVVHSGVQDRAAAAEFCRRYGEGYLEHASRGDAVRLRELQAGVAARFTQQADHLVPHLAAVWDALAAGDSISPPIDALAGAARRMVASLRALHGAEIAPDDVGNFANARGTSEARVRRVLVSQVHMLHNRLGITNQEEGVIAVLCANALSTGVLE